MSPGSPTPSASATIRFKQLLANANKIAGVLGNRSEQINRLLVNAQTLLAAVNERGQAIDVPAGERVGGLEQFAGIHRRQPEPQPRARAAAARSATILVKRKVDLADSLTTRVEVHRAHWPRRSRPARTSRSWWSTCCPTRSCSRSSTRRSRSAASTRRSSGATPGLPAFRFPDPNGTPIPQRRAAAGPDRCWKAHRSIPGPAVLAGSPCSYTPAAETAFRPPGDPLPCAAPDAGSVRDGPYGTDYGPPNVMSRRRRRTRTGRLHAGRHQRRRPG